MPWGVVGPAACHPACCVCVGPLSTLPCPPFPQPWLRALRSQPRLAWAHPHSQLCSAASGGVRRAWPSRHLGPAAQVHAGHFRPHCSGAGVLGEVGPLLPQVSGPPAAEALQTHNTVFQEHTAPSSPGAAPATRGFRRASEISIASQVSGMAESYTASSIAQSECLAWPPSTLPSVLQGAACPPRNSQKCLDTAGEGEVLAPGGERPGMLPDTLQCPGRTRSGE